MELAPGTLEADLARTRLVGIGLTSYRGVRMRKPAARAIARAPSMKIVVLGGGGYLARAVDALRAAQRSGRAAIEVEVAGRSGTATGLTVGFPEASMLHASSNVPTVRVAFSPRPALLRYAFALIPAFIMGSWFSRMYTLLYFTVLRRFLLARRTTRVELVCVARGGGDEGRAGLVTEDGMRAGGGALAAQAIRLAEAPPRGLQHLDAALPLAETITLANALLPAGARIRSA